MSARTELTKLLFFFSISHDVEDRRHARQARSSLVRATADFLPKIKRGFFGGEEKEEENVVSAGWKVEVRTRKEREETLRQVLSVFTRKVIQEDLSC